MDSSVALYFELQNKIDEFLVKLDECFEAINSISLWKSMNGVKVDPHEEDFQASMEASIEGEFGEDVAEHLMEILFR